MKITIFFLLCISFLTPKPNMQDQVRVLFEQALEQETACKKLIAITKNYTTASNPVIAGYHASATIMMAKYVYNPYQKYTYFKEGKTLLEQAITAAPNAFDLRFLRFALQNNLPSILGYSSNIAQDKQFVFDNIHLVKENSLKQLLVSYFAVHNPTTIEEKKIIEGLKK